MNRHSVPNATMGFPGRPRDGGSHPRFYHFDDDVTRLVKWHPSRQGSKVAYNELVASRLGQLVGAPILRGTVVYVADKIIPDEHRADGAAPGFHFGITQMEGDNFVPAQHYAEIENLSQLPAAAVHLAWLAVGDQEVHNQFLQRREPRPHGPTRAVRFMLIDMGFMFGGPAWTASSLQEHQNYTFPRHIAERLTFKKLEPAITALRDVSDAAVAACVGDRPEEWAIPDEDVQAAMRVVISARDRIEDIIKAGNTQIERGD